LNESREDALRKRERLSLNTTYLEGDVRQCALEFSLAPVRTLAICKSF
jgi:hypothetical protein